MENKKEQVENDFEQFYGDIIASNDVLRVTIPKKVVDVANLKAGQKVKVFLKVINTDE